PFIFGRHFIPGNEPRLERQIGRHSEHDLPDGIDRHAAPVEYSEIAGINQRTLDRWRRIAPFVAKAAELDAASELVEHGDAPHVRPSQGFRTEGQPRYGL